MEKKVVDLLKKHGLDVDVYDRAKSDIPQPPVGCEN